MLPVATYDTQNHFAADGTETLWDFSFAGGYIDPSHVKAYYKVGENLTVAPLTLVATTRARVFPAAPAGSTLVIYRDTPKGAPLVDWDSAATVDRTGLAVTSKQALFVAAEEADWRGVGTVGDLAELAAGAALAVATATAAASSAAASAAMADDYIAATQAAAASAAVSAGVATAAAASAAAAGDTAAAARVADLVEDFATSGGADGIGWSPTRNYAVGTIGHRLKAATGYQSALTEIAPSAWDNILNFTQTTDVAAGLQAVLSAPGGTFMPEGYWPIGATLETARPIEGVSAKRTIIAPLSDGFDAIKVTDTAGDFLRMSGFRVVFPTRGVGRGIVLDSNNNDVTIEQVNVQKARIAFDSEDIAFMQTFRQCRADNCDTAFHAKGTSSTGAGAGTTMIYEQCYATNNTRIGWDLEMIRSVLMMQPTTDMANTMTNAIVCTGVGQLVVLDHHFEGTPAAPTGGAYFAYVTNGNLAHGVNVDGGQIEAADLSSLNYRYIDIAANDDHVRVNLRGVNFRNVTVGPFNYLAKITGNSSSKVTIILEGCNFNAAYSGGGTRDLSNYFDTSGFAGVLEVRYLDRERSVLASGQATIQSGDTISVPIPVGTDLPQKAFAQVVTDNGALPSAIAHVTNTSSALNPTIQVRFTRRTATTLAEVGAEIFGTPFTVNWFVLS